MKKTYTLLFFMLLFQTGFSQAWKQLDSISQPRNRSGSFAIGDTGYVVAGGNSWYLETAFAYGSLSNIWSSIQNYPSDQDDGVVGGAINGLGYAGTGAYAGYNFGNSFYVYDPGNNTWTQLANVPGQGRGFAVSFVAGGKIYIGGGLNGTNNNPLNDFYAYDPVAAKWDTIAPCPAAGVSFRAVGFSINGKGYVGTGGKFPQGSQSYVPQNDFWEYDPGTNTWTQMANVPGKPRMMATGWATCDKGYIGLGCTTTSQTGDVNDFWQYDPVKNAWTQIANYGGTARVSASAWVIGNTGYVCCGVDSLHGLRGDLWSFTPTFTPAFSAAPTTCAGQSIAFTDTSTYSPTNWQWSFPGGTPDTSSSQSPVITYDSAGTYTVILTAWNTCGDSGTIVDTNYITVSPAPIKPVFTKDTSFCGNFSLTLSSGSTGFNYRWSTGDTTHNLTVTTLGSYWVSVSSSCDTVTSDTINVVVDTNTILNIIPQAPFLCSGASVVLSVSGGGSGFTWSPSSGLSSTTGDSVTASPSASITYMVSGTDSIGCPGHGTDLVTLIPAPNKPTITIHWDTLISSATSDNQWNYENVPINGATNPTLVVSGSTSGYSVTVTNEANGCTTTSDTSTTTGINQLSVISEQLSIYPNPFNNNIFIKISPLVSDLNDWNLQLTDVLGRTIYTTSSLNYNNEIDLSGLAGGIYFITVINKTARAVFPVVKQN